MCVKFSKIDHGSGQPSLGAGGRLVKIDWARCGQPRAQPAVFYQDHRCGHNVKLSAEQVGAWPDEIRLSELEPGLFAAHAASAARS